MSHDPSHWREIILEYKYPIDLQLSGHTHGMQSALKFLILNGVQLNIDTGNEAGLYKNNNKQIYVNRGLGHLGYTEELVYFPIFQC